MLVTASQIHDGKGWLPSGTVLELAEDGTILGIHTSVPSHTVMVYEGIICPGFVNTHCHLELSHMKGMVPEHTGLIPFLQTIPRHRNDHSEEEKAIARLQALQQMVANGIVAVGDIANTADTTDLRALDLIHFYTFVEAIGFSAHNAEHSFNRAVAVLQDFENQHSTKKILKQTIVPHAPYSVSATLFGLIGSNGSGTISVHNQESLAEDEYYRYKKGAVKDLLHSLGINDDLFVPPGKSSLVAYLDWLPNDRPLILVHNTYTTEEDLTAAMRKISDLYLCLCPGANLYIEDRLPDVSMFLLNDAKICIGTDSLASNHELSILRELQLLKKHFPFLDWESLLQWGTYNGACALQVDKVAGHIAVGKKPGIINIPHLMDHIIKPVT